MKNELESVLQNLSKHDKKIYDFSKHELLVYINYRFNNLLWHDTPVSFRELRYNLCEVGPGNRRIDPLLLAVILNSEGFKERYAINQFEKSGEIYYYYAQKTINEEMLLPKSNVISKFSQLKKSPQLHENIRSLFAKTIEQSCSINNMSVSVEEECIECEFTYQNEDKKVLLRYYNSGEWLYIDDKRLWSLFEKASHLNAVPVVLCSYMHKSCFSIFKKIGMYGRSLYYCFIEETIDKIIAETLAGEERKKMLSVRFGLERIHDINLSLQSGEMDEVLQLLESVRNVHDNALVRMRKVVPVIEPISGELIGDHGSITYRLALMKKLVKILKIKESNLLGKMIGFYNKMM